MIDYNCLKEKLKTDIIGRYFIQFESLQSTTRKAKAIAPHSPDGMVVCAENQWEDKTKHGKEWFSPPGGLYISTIISLDNKRDYSSLLTLLGGTAAYQAMKELGLNSELKWPNDIMIEGKKIGAVFCDSINYDNHLKYIFTINLNVSIKRELLEKNIDCPAISLNEIYDMDITMEDMMAKLLNRIEHLIETCIIGKKCEDLYEPWEQYINQFNNHARIRKYGNKKWIDSTIIGFNNSGDLGFMQSNGMPDVVDTKKYEIMMIKELNR